MKIFETIKKWYGCAIPLFKQTDGVPLLALRLFVAPLMIEAGWRKFNHFDSTAAWFGNDLALPFPELMALMATAAELVGGIFLLLGLMTRLVSIPLMVTMLVAAFLVHAENGWLAISDSSSMYANERVMEAAPKKQMIKDLVKDHGDYSELTSSGSITILNDGMEFAITYFVMLLVLFFYGGGRYVSVDYWLSWLREKFWPPDARE